MTEYDICNTALAYIGQTETITDYTSNTTASALCGRLYPIAYKNLMEEYPWSFAVKTATLTAVTDETSEEYSFVYEYPSDCLRILKLIPCPDGQVIDYEVQYTLDGTTDVKRIFCDLEDAKVVYIMDIDNPAQFTSSFADALAWDLAVRLAIPLSADAKTIQMVQQFRQMAVSKAKLLNAKEQRKPINRPNRYIEARG